MSKIIIKDCIITLKDSEVLKEYGEDRYYNYHTGIDLKAKEIYSPFRGVVVQKCFVDDIEHYGIVLQYSENICLRFTNLKECYVVSGSTVETNQKVGLADGFVHFEYLTSEENYPSFKVFLTNEVAFFKHDPWLILSGNILFDQGHLSIEYTTEKEYETWKAFYDSYGGEVPQCFGFDLAGDYD